MSRSVVIVGGGLVGLATARALLRSGHAGGVTVLEKESKVGQHQSGRNSGVLHAGLHYRPGSHKARLSVEGIREMVAFCEEHDVTHARCGKVVVASRPEEVPRLAELERRGTANGLRGLRRLSISELREREPHVDAIDALLVPEEGVVDFSAVARALSDEVERTGGVVRTGVEVLGVGHGPGGWVLDTSGGVIPAAVLVGCAGLHADRVARMAGADPPVRIVPFRGAYYRLRAEAAYLVQHMIYPVPDPAFPFLGVHLHRRVDGTVEAGPTAMPALSREGYHVTDLDSADMAELVAFPGLWRFAFRYPRMCAEELYRSLSGHAFAAALRRLVPAVEEGDLSPAPAGVRAQAMTPDGHLVEDFSLVERAHDIHVLNAPSPGATASLAIGRWLGAKVLERLQ